jgi:dedicator of cytokinesis protein 3
MQPLPPLRSGPDQIIWVTSVNPEPDLSHRVFSNGVNENVQLYHRYNNIKTFSTLRPYKVLSASTRSEDENAGVMTWLEKTTLTCEPTVLFYHAKADYCRQGNIPLCSRQK